MNSNQKSQLVKTNPRNWNQVAFGYSGQVTGIVVNAQRTYCALIFDVDPETVQFARGTRTKQIWNLINGDLIWQEVTVGGLYDSIRPAFSLDGRYVGFINRGCVSLIDVNAEGPKPEMIKFSDRDDADFMESLCISSQAQRMALVWRDGGRSIRLFRESVANGRAIDHLCIASYLLYTGAGYSPYRHVLHYLHCKATDAIVDNFILDRITPIRFKYQVPFKNLWNFKFCGLIDLSSSGSISEIWAVFMARARVPSSGTLGSIWPGRTTSDGVYCVSTTGYAKPRYLKLSEGETAIVSGRTVILINRNAGTVSEWDTLGTRVLANFDPLAMKATWKYGPVCYSDGRLISIHTYSGRFHVIGTQVVRS